MSERSSGFLLTDYQINDDAHHAGRLCGGLHAHRAHEPGGGDAVLPVRGERGEAPEHGTQDENHCDGEYEVCSDGDDSGAAAGMERTHDVAGMDIQSAFPQKTRNARVPRRGFPVPGQTPAQPGIKT